MTWTVLVGMSTSDTPAPRVLIAEDSAAARRVLSLLVRTAGHEVVVVSDGEEALAALVAPDGPDIAVLDWEMPGLSGPDVCRQVRAGACGERYVYLVLLTAHDDPRRIAEGLDAGADDFVTKGADAGVLRARLRTGARVVRLVHDLHAARESLREQATRDALTRLWNRGAALDLLDTETARAERSGSDVGVLLFDVDHFKTVNDTHGHLVGDDVLRELGKRLSSTLRAGDILGRIGGEELLAILPVESKAHARLAAERLRLAIARAPFPTRVGPLEVTASVGVTSLRHVGTREREALLADADAALYRAKHAGRNRVVAPWDSAVTSAEAVAALVTRRSGRAGLPESVVSSGNRP